MVIGNKKDLASSGSARRAVTEANGAALARVCNVYHSCKSFSRYFNQNSFRTDFMGPLHNACLI